MPAPSFDAIVVGSGITGGWAAKELCERGLKTLVLEAGRPIDSARDYVEHVPPWAMKFRGFGDRKALERDQFIQRHCYACNEYSGKFFVNDRENPYSFDADKPFHWIRGRQVGGRSIMWGRQVYRWSDLDFEANARDGFGVDWPIRYADIAPWYDHVEEFIGISGEALGLPQLRDGEFRARVVFLCASTLESTRILLNSKTPRFPMGLANSSGELGKNLMDHIMGGGAAGMIPGMEDHAVHGHRPNGIYVPRFRNVKTPHPDLLRGYGFQGGADRAGWGRVASQPGFGVELKRGLHTPGPWHFSFYGFGECLPRPTNYVELDSEKVDAWGIPALRIHCEWSDNERKLLHDMSVTGAEMLEAASAHDVHSFTDDNPPGLTIHEMGTARMGRDPKTSVLNAHNQCHDVKNLFVTDGACMASTACQNPSITYMALTARAAAYAVEAMKRNEL